MRTPDIAVIDYGIGNLLSVRRALEHCGANVNVTSDHQAILSSAGVILPGVGAFRNGMGELNRLGLNEVARKVAGSGIPLLGICLGMQMLFDESEEFGICPGLGLVPGRIVPIPASVSDGGLRKIPHIGWSPLVLPQNKHSWEGTLLQEIAPSEAVYFVHSFMAMPVHDDDRLAECMYEALPISAVVARGNVFGCQFHPEKSGAVGLKILRHFVQFAGSAAAR